MLLLVIIPCDPSKHEVSADDRKTPKNIKLKLLNFMKRLLKVIIDGKIYFINKNNINNNNNKNNNEKITITETITITKQ